MIVTDYQYDQNTKSDISFLEEYIDQADDTGRKTTIITDGFFSSQELKKKAEEKGFILITKDLTGREAKDIHTGFKFTEEGGITECPAGYKPKNASYIKQTGQCRASFKRSQCETYPYKDE